MRRLTLIGAMALSVVLVLAASEARAQQGHAARRERAAVLMRQGNWNEALTLLRALVENAGNDRVLVAQDLTSAVSCLGRLGRTHEIDALVEAAVKAHPKSWRLSLAAARAYNSGQHYGYLVAGEFHRGHHRGGGKYVMSYERDRRRALQLMSGALPAVADEPDRAAAFTFYYEFAQALARTVSGGSAWDAWRLQSLSDLDALPDYVERRRYYHRGYANRGAPADPDGSPVLHEVPRGWDAAKTDGERWRWLLVMAQEVAPERTGEILMHRAQFAHQQFGVQTMVYGRRYGRAADDAKGAESGPYAVRTLGEDETIARLAVGIKRFTLPADHNHIRLCQRILDEGRDSWRVQAAQLLASAFENRQQYTRAVEYWRIVGNRERVDQIIGNWGQFEALVAQPAGGGAEVEYRFRNAKAVTFEAFAIDTEALLADIKEYIRAEPPRLDHRKVQLQRWGVELIDGNKQRYVGRNVASWGMPLEPRPGHFDRRITVQTPLREPGAYLLSAHMSGGNVSSVVVWVADTVIVKKPLVNETMVYVADAVTGRPIDSAEVSVFGYRQEWRRGTRTYDIRTRDVSLRTDMDGIAYFEERDSSRYRWVITARTPGGRFAYQGWSSFWRGSRYDAQYHATRAFVMTDRPVYRPAQPVRFKAWVAEAKYDLEGGSRFASQRFRVKIHTPKGDVAFDKTLEADRFGGVASEWESPKDATLGMYRVTVEGSHVRGGSGWFRVEEYKKPEYEVKIEAPDEPVMLGDKVEATVTSTYYFGGPVTHGRIKYKVMRTTHAATWYPPRYWDWFYGPGYWWYAYDYDWYPGWGRWGCRRPWPWWWSRPQPQPEVVLENECELGADGTVKIEIDTALAEAMLGDSDHRYDITAEVTDQSRRTIVGTGRVLVAREPFKVYAWVDRGHYRTGDTVAASFSAFTLDHKPVVGRGRLSLYKVSYGRDMTPVESVVETWDLPTSDEGTARQQLTAAAPGQYRLSYAVTDARGRAMEGGYVFTVSEAGFDGSGYRFDDLELVTDKAEYAPGDRARLMVNTDRAGAAVLLFVRPANGIGTRPRVLAMSGKSVLQDVVITKKDMPNFFVEALTVHHGKVHQETREIIVPPEERVLKAEIVPDKTEYRPGEEAKVTLRLSELNGEPYDGSAVVSVYDKAVEYVSGGSNVPEIKSFFWKWRRRHHAYTEHSLARGEHPFWPRGQRAMSYLGVFAQMMLAREQGIGVGGGATVAHGANDRVARRRGVALDAVPTLGAAAPAAAKSAPAADGAFAVEKKADKSAGGAGGPSGAPAEMAVATVRTEFADTAYWAADLRTSRDGETSFTFPMPENLTTWKIKAWAMGGGTRVGQAEVEVLTTKKLIVRLQAPRFFVQKDEVVLSANVHNYLAEGVDARVTLELEGPCLEAPAAGSTREVRVEAKDETRVDWRVKVVKEGTAVVRMKALSAIESDAMEMSFPAYVHGMPTQEAFSGNIRPERTAASVRFVVPKDRRPDESRLEVRYSPTLAGAMVDALPYLCSYPHGCTEQTLNRFLPTVITQNVLRRSGVDLKSIRDKITNLNAQELGEAKERAAQWRRYKHAPVFDENEVAAMVADGVATLGRMQCSDGGWGWFSGWGEHSYPHTTAVVVHGLQVARENDAVVDPGVIDRGVRWLAAHQAFEVEKLQNWDTKTKPWKRYADDTDALVYMVLVDAERDSEAMRAFLYRDRNQLSVYGKAMFGLALHRIGEVEKRDMLLRNVEQYLKQDDENQTAWLELPGNTYWWRWYGDENETHAYYLKLLAAVEPRSERASRLVKYLLNNRKHGTYWNSTRDTAACIEAMAEYLAASGEGRPDMFLEIRLDGEPVKSVSIDAENLFTFDNAFVLEGRAVTDGPHTIELVRKGRGPVYFNAYVNHFSLEDPIKKAGLEIKVDREYYLLKPVEATREAEGARGQVLTQKVEKYERVPLADLATLTSGDLVEVELEIASKNDYEYIIFEDMKPAGCEPVEVRSGYTGNEMHAYVEFRDERVCFFVRALARGSHSVSYRLRAEIPGKFSALPTRAAAMYAPELKAHSDEMKLRIEDR